MKSLKEFREESNGNTRMLWHHDYWDGPISGVILWDGEYCWFQQNDEVNTEIPFTEEERKNWIEECIKHDYEIDERDMVNYDSYRVYDVYRMPVDVMDNIRHNHELFRKYVGVHTDYDENGKREIGNLRPYTEHDKFYNTKSTHKPVDFNLKSRELIGVFKY